MHLTRTRTFLIVGLATALAYFNTLPNGFVWDDEALVHNNQFIRNSTYFDAIFTTDLSREASKGVAYYRPLQTISYMADYFVWGVDPLGYHLTNVLLHLAGALLLCFILEIITGQRLIAFIVALLFAVHPVNTNAVTYIAGRADPLAFLGMLGAWALWLAYRNNSALPLQRRILLFAGSLLCYAAALFSRESAMLFPLLLLLYCLTLDPVKTNRLRHAVGSVAPFAILLVAFLCWRSAVLNLSDKTLVVSWSLPLSVRWQIPFRALATYLGLLVCPLHLQMERQVILGGAGLYVLTAVGIFTAVALGLALRSMYQRSPVVFFGLCWFVVALVPMLGTLNLVATLAEHWLYVPSVGFYLAAVAWGTQTVREIEHRRVPCLPRLVNWACILALMALCARTMLRNEDWINAATFYAKTLQSAQHSQRLRNNLGATCLRLGRPTDALKQLQQAEQMNPRDLLAKSNLAAYFARIGDLDSAIAKNKECLALDPNDSDTWLRLAAIYAQQGNLKQAQLHFLGANATDHSADLHVALQYGIFLTNHRQLREALNVVAAAYQRDPGDAQLFNLLGAILMQRKQFVQAADAFRMARSLDRHSAQADINLARIACRQGDLTGALTYLRQALRIDPQEPQIRYHMGIIHWRLGQLHSAKQELTAALSIAPNNPQIRTALEKLQRGASFASL